MDSHHQKHHSSLGSNLAFLSLLLACVVYLSIWSSSSSLNPLSAFQKNDECVSENPVSHFLVLVLRCIWNPTPDLS